MPKPVKITANIFYFNFLFMKKFSGSLMAVMLALFATAFTISNAKTHLANPYWYQTQNDGTVINPGSAPPQSASDPFNCTGTAHGCSKAFTSYNPVTFAPIGDPVQTDKKD
jgi:hypothetical protein